MNDDVHTALAKLREPFPPGAISKLPKGKEDKTKRRACNTCKGYHDPSMFHLDYVGHAALTDRLLTVDPEWTWAPFATDERGSPVLDRNAQGGVVGLWINLTVCGMTRPGYGSVEPGKSDAVKELIGDALRNAAMRFGCALDLWHKGDLPFDDEATEQPDPHPPATRQPPAEAKPSGDGITDGQKKMIAALRTKKQDGDKWVDRESPDQIAELEYRTLLDGVYKVDSTTKLSKAEASKFIEALLDPVTRATSIEWARKKLAQEAEATQ